jgi:hypothetical protein
LVTMGGSVTTDVSVTTAGSVTMGGSVTTDGSVTAGWVGKDGILQANNSTAKRMNGIGFFMGAPYLVGFHEYSQGNNSSKHTTKQVWVQAEKITCFPDLHPVSRNASNSLRLLFPGLPGCCYCARWRTGFESAWSMLYFQQSFPIQYVHQSGL